jgi:DNA-binding NtrC family response regulator
MHTIASKHHIKEEPFDKFTNHLSAHMPKDFFRTFRILSPTETGDRLECVIAKDGTGPISFINHTQNHLIMTRGPRLIQQNGGHSVYNGRQRLAGPVIGTSKKMTGILETLVRYACSNANVLITGESGVGKEMMARFIHLLSRRWDKPYVVTNCAMGPTDLVASTLFGHVKGAFTGAIRNKKGYFMLADDGTLFLDEVGSASTVTQTALLRVLEDGVIIPVGSERSTRVDTRIVAATNTDLDVLCRSSSFRRDLYYRLNVLTLNLPPLRERPEDILPIANFYVTYFSAQCRRDAPALSPAAMQALLSHRWGGNVRELKNAVHRAVLLYQGDAIHVSDFQNELQSSFTDCDHDYIPSPDDIASAARLLGMEILDLEAMVCAYYDSTSVAARDASRDYATDSNGTNPITIGRSSPESDDYATLAELERRHILLVYKDCSVRKYF